MNHIKNIFLSWRLGKSFSRIMVGSIEKSESGVSFCYLKDGVREAKKYGFNGYPGLSLDQTEHTVGAIELFSKRLINLERSDTKELFDFWEVDTTHRNDTFYMLAMTQGKMQTDSFEFLASFLPVSDDVCFVTDVAGINYYKLNLNNLKEGVLLDFKKEPDNKTDINAVKVLYKGELVGYIKKGHNEFFNRESNNRIKISVKSIINTSFSKELYVKVYMQ